MTAAIVIRKMSEKIWNGWVHCLVRIDSEITVSFNP